MRASTTIIMLSSLSCAFAAPIGVGEISATVGSLVDDAPDAASPGAGDPELVAVASALVPGVLYTDAAVAINMCGLLNSVLGLLDMDAFDCGRMPTYAPPETSECDASAPPTLHAVAPQDDSGDDGGDSWDDGDGAADDGEDDSGDDWDGSGSDDEDDADLGGLGLDDGGDDAGDGVDDAGDDNEDDGNWEDCECDEDEDDGSGASDVDLELPTETWVAAEPAETAAPEQDDGDDDLAAPPVLHAVAPSSVDDDDYDEPTSGGGSLLPCLDPCVSGALDTVLHLGVGDILGGDSPVGSLVHVATGNELGGDDNAVSNLVHVAVGNDGNGLLGGGNGLLGGTSGGDGLLGGGGGGGLLGGLL